MPASFSSHVVDRDMEEYIAKQQVENTHADLMFGGGLSEFNKRQDGLDLTSVAQGS